MIVTCSVVVQNETAPGEVRSSYVQGAHTAARCAALSASSHSASSIAGVWSIRLRNPALDGLRAIAVIAVVGFHAKLPGLRGGFLGVDIFFVLSGFLITGLLLAEIRRTGHLDLAGFLTRRALRLLPAFALMLAGFALIAPLALPDVDIGTELLLSGLFISNVTQAAWQSPTFTAHSWSLATEMQFYLVWPLAMLALARLPSRALIVVFVLLYAAATIWRIVQFGAAGWNYAYYSPDTRLSGFMLGALAAALPASRPGARATAALIAGLTLLASALAASRFTWPTVMTVTLPLAEIGTLLVILGLRQPETLLARLLSARPLVLIGTWSYGIYLWHYPIARWMEITYDDPLFEFAATLALATALAAASFTLVEQPLRRWFLRRAAPAPAGQA
jgi:peptidoglycan/LPS O-acetylase OafA/YrhL